MNKRNYVLAALLLFLNTTIVSIDNREVGYFINAAYNHKLNEFNRHFQNNKWAVNELRPVYDPTRSDLKEKYTALQALLIKKPQVGLVNVPNIAKQLLAAGADPNVELDGKPLFCQVLKWNNTQLIEYLLDYGALPSVDGDSPSAKADNLLDNICGLSDFQNQQVINLIKKYYSGERKPTYGGTGAKPTVMPKPKEQKKTKEQEIIEQAYLADENVINKITDPNVVAKIDALLFPVTPLIALAAGPGDDEKRLQIAEQLIQKGANINQSVAGTGGATPTPLSVALGRTTSDLAKFFIQRGADVSKITPNMIAGTWQDKNDVWQMIELKKAAPTLAPTQAATKQPTTPTAENPLEKALKALQSKLDALAKVIK